MKRICGWCGKDMGYKEPLSDSRITHSICPECSRKALEEVKDGQEESGRGV